MARTIIRNISGQTLTLPLPYHGVLQGGAATVVAEDEATAIAYLGGNDLIGYIWDVFPVNENELVGPVVLEDGATSVIRALAAAPAPVGVNGQRVTGLGAPSAASDAATKAYVDGNTSAGGNSVIFKPSGGAGVLTTWAEVMAAVASSPVPLRIIVVEGVPNDTLVPPGTWDMRYATLAGPSPAANSGLYLDDGAVLLDIRAVDSLTVAGASTTGPCLEFTPTGGGLVGVTVYDTGLFVNASPSNLPMVSVSAGEAFALAAQSARAFQSTGPAFMDLAAGALGVVAFAGPLLDSLPTNLASGEVGSTFAVSHPGIAGPYDALVQPGFAGTLVNMPSTLVGGSGPTSQQPVGFPPGNPPSVGATYYDTDLGYLIVWNGSAWVAV